MKLVIIGGIENEQSNFDYTMEELANLAHADNMEVVGEIRQNIEKPVSATYFGKGKVEEIRERATALDAEALIVNDELLPTQIRNLEEDTGLDIIDRTALILDIFASRAHTRIAKLQVKIAQLQYQLPRIRTASINKMDQQTAGGNTGGGFTNRGTGETQIELNRRVIQKQISSLRKELKEVQRDTDTQRKKRQRSDLKSVALVGYTNAGKSTTMNNILDYLDINDSKRVFEKDMLFATLDTYVRKITLPDKKVFILSDTVGFVSKLPHQLVEAFKSTLLEAAEADLLIQVIDVSDPNYRQMIKTTEKTLKEIGVDNIPMIYAFNKADKANIPYPTVEGNQFTYCARDQKSIEMLLSILKKELFKDYETHTFLIPFSEGQYVDLLNKNANIQSTEYQADGTLITADVAPKLKKQLEKFEIE